MAAGMQPAHDVECLDCEKLGTKAALRDNQFDLMRQLLFGACASPFTLAAGRSFGPFGARLHIVSHIATTAQVTNPKTVSRPRTATSSSISVSLMGARAQGGTPTE